MAAATQRTKWRRLVKKQLDASNLPTENEMFYRPFVNVIYQVAIRNKFGDDIYRIERSKLIKSLHGYLDNHSAYPWEQDIILYTAGLLMDATEDKASPAFQGASLFCGECLMPVKINKSGTRYVCPHCNAQAKAGLNRIPLGIPVLQEMRSERDRLHRRMDSVMGPHKRIAAKRDKYYRVLSEILGKPYELTHIGFITCKADVIQWDMAIDVIENTKSQLIKEASNV